MCVCDNVCDARFVVVPVIRLLCVLYFNAFMHTCLHSSNDPHFAIVPRSLVYAAKDVLLLLVVLGLMMVAFAAILGALFGAKLGNFATFEDALIQVLLMTLGEWGDPYHDIYDVAEYPKMWTLLFVLYNVVVVLVTMNIL